MSWTEERVNLLKQLWGEGKTAAEIAKVLGDGVTRNAVIGKAHRLKLSSRVSPIQQAPLKTKADKPKAVKRVAPVKRPEFKGKAIKMAQLENGMCRWPNGDPQDAEFSFCGCPAIPGLPYCEEHAAVAYQVSTRTRKLDANDFNDDAGAPAEFDIKHAAAS